jgi:hypothetical protein
MSSCGEDSNAGLSGERASDLRSTLNRVEDDVSGGDCTGAAQQAGEFRQEVASLPSRVNSDLRDALERSATRLESLVSEQCQAAPAEEPPAQEPTVTDENGGNQQDEPKKDKKPKKQKGTTGQEGSTGVTGQEGSTGVTGQEGTTLPPEGG